MLKPTPHHIPGHALDEELSTFPRPARQAFYMCQQNQNGSLLETANQSPNNGRFLQASSREAGCQLWKLCQAWPAPPASLRLGARSPCIQDALILRQLPHEACVGPRDTPLLLHVVIRFLQRPAELLHGVCDDRGRRPADAHLAMDQALGMIPSAGDFGGGD